jgi:sodium transport system ATP-binding protein
MKDQDPTPADATPSDPPTKPALSAHDLCRSYGKHRAVHKVSFQIHAGEIFGLLGPNGAGKTSLLRMLAGILVPNAGHAEILGKTVSKDDRELRRHLGYLSGDTSLYARLSVIEMLQYFGRLYGLSPDHLETQIGKMVADFGLEAFKDQRCGALSSGQSQRANLARAFVADPKILILDEPTIGLDVISGQFVLKAISRARDAGKAVLFSTHIMSEVDKLCDRIGLLLAGELRAVGKRAQLLEAYQSEDLSELLLKLHEQQESERDS